MWWCLYKLTVEGIIDVTLNIFHIFNLFMNALGKSELQAEERW